MFREQNSRWEEKHEGGIRNKKKAVKVWGVSQNLMKDYWKEGMSIFSVLVKSVALY